jgi:hypothetical protein
MPLITNLLTNMVVLNFLGDVTNTPALEEYARPLMVHQAQVLSRKWNLDPGIVESNRITHFETEPRTCDFGVSIAFGDRYHFGKNAGGGYGFTDKAGWKESQFPKLTEDRLASQKEELAAIDRWRRATNLLTMAKAQRLAESALRSMDLPDGSFGSPDVKEQLKWAEGPEWVEENGKIRLVYKDNPESFLLPYYTFEWEGRRRSATVHVSGILSNVVHVSVYPGYPALQRPTNYLELLGYRTNTIFVHRLLHTSPPIYEAIDERTPYTWADRIAAYRDEIAVGLIVVFFGACAIHFGFVRRR